MPFVVSAWFGCTVCPDRTDPGRGLSVTSRYEPPRGARNLEAAERLGACRYAKVVLADRPSATG